MKFVTIVGARPQFIKAAAVSRVIRKECNEIIVHTGQHYDKNMSDIFFDELKIPKPDYNLGVGSGSHAKQTAQMMIGIEEILLKEEPQYLMVYGDTNSTLAGAIAASKIHIPIIHIEAGLRSFNMRMPEELNRILTDRISKYLFCPTEKAVDNLKNEGVCEGVYNVGDVMCDAIMFYKKMLTAYESKDIFKRMNIIYPQKIVGLPDKWYLATIHRAENTDNINKIKEILAAFEELECKVIFPVHPRTINMVKQLCQENEYKNLILSEPIGYLDIIYLTQNAQKVITDSGGLQKEAYMLDTPCVTVRDQTEWVETLIGNNNILAKPDKKDIVNKVLNISIDKSVKKNYYGDGNAANKIINIIRGGNQI